MEDTSIIKTILINPMGTILVIKILKKVVKEVVEGLEEEAQQESCFRIVLQVQKRITRIKRKIIKKVCLKNKKCKIWLKDSNMIQ